MSTATPAEAIINGVRQPLEAAALPLSDEGVARGDGAFETVGVWGGVPFRLDDHFARLRRSLDAVGLPEPDLDALRGDVRVLLHGVDADAALRMFVTASGTRIVTLGPQPPRRTLRRLVARPAPWVRPLGTYGPAGAKIMSYGPNMAATRAAQVAGGDDALLVSLEGFMLEGPTFCVAWLADGVLHTPTVGLGIVDSISRRSIVEIAGEQGLAVEEGPYDLDALAGASEFLACSSVRPVLALEQVDRFRFDAVTPVRDRLAAALEARRRHR
jgi:branched-subunit amino acid aminotransferase/4-amino-4-deoxychorismate lyase